MKVAFYTNKKTLVHLMCSSKIRCAIHCKGFLEILRIGSPLYGRWAWGQAGRERECTDNKNRSSMSLADQREQCKFLTSFISPDSVAQKHFRATNDLLEVPDVASVMLLFPSFTALQYLYG